MSSVDPVVSTLHQWIEVFMRRSTRNFIRYARKSGLSMSQLGAMFHLQRMGSTGVTGLGDHLGVSNAAVSQMLERLVQQGLILRSENPTDRRVKQIVLTDKGLQIYQESIRARQSWLDDLTEVLSTDEKEQITEALNILIDKANQLEQPIETEC
jgi:DNA-binding MarR family transcriptional regulator